MRHELIFTKPMDFSLNHAIFGHGWYDLPPFIADASTRSLETTFLIGSRPISILIKENGKGLTVLHNGRTNDGPAIERIARHVLRIDEDLSPFYSMIPDDDALQWAARAKAGRLLRSPTVFEDLIKTLCTTNCSWALTRLMVTRLVEITGIPGKNGKKAFPTAAILAQKDEDFFRSEIRAGYRSPYFVELCQKVTSGDIEPESWLICDLPTPELKKEIKKIKGIGDYAAENLLKLLGRYDGLTLDSWLRSGFYKKRNKGRKCPDKKIERHYSKYKEWKGLAIWCDMTEEWFEEKA